MNKKPKSHTVVAVAILAGQGVTLKMLFKNHTPAAFSPIPRNIPKTYFSLKTFPSRFLEFLKTQNRCSKNATAEPADRPIMVAKTGVAPKYVSATWNIEKSAEVANKELEPYLPNNRVAFPAGLSFRA